jgi:hypothetical protein
VKPLRLFAAAFFAISAAASAQTEGVAKFKGTVHTDRGQTIPSQGTVYVAKVGVRVEWETDMTQVAADGKDRKDHKGMMPDHMRLVILQMLSEPGKTYTLNPETKTYSVRESSKQKPPATVRDREWKVQKLGHDTVAGYSCEKALITSDAGNETEVCVSKELVPTASWVAAMNQREDQSGPLKALKESGLEGFPIRWIFRSQKNREISSTMELVSFDRKSLPASLFEIPSDYKKSEGGPAWMSPEQQKAMSKAMEDMTPEQRKQLEEYLKGQQQQRPEDPQP